jgi:hypothetical protein
MYTKTLLTFAVALIGASAATFAFAGEVTPDYPTAYSSSVTRAAVREAAIVARQAGQIGVGEQSVVIEQTGPGLTRAQVRAEAIEAIRLGLNSRGDHSPLPTQEQLSKIHMAGLQALSMTVALR